jgi:hypothetical protein
MPFTLFRCTVVSCSIASGGGGGDVSGGSGGGVSGGSGGGVSGGVSGGGVGAPTRFTGPVCITL